MTPNTPDSTPPASGPETLTLSTRLRNFLIVLVAIALSVAIFLGVQTETSSTSLSEMAEESTPLEVALSNHQPTLIEFYADWCTTCQAMAPDLSAIKQQYSDRLNFVMLNVDNSKWLPEVLEYRVDGIPHFVFVNDLGDAIAQTIGEMPRSVMEANLEALIADSPLPYAEATGQVSAFTPSVVPTNSGSSDPRSHGSTVIN